MNLGVADYDGLQTQISYRGNREDVRGAQLHAVQGDQHHRAGRQRHRAEREQHRRGSARRSADRACVDQRHRAVITFTYQLPYNITAGTVTQLASARPFNADDRRRQQRRRREQRPAGRRRRGHRQVGVPRHRHAGRRRCSSRAASSSAGRTILLRLEGFNLFNHGNILGRAQTIYGDTGDGRTRRSASSSPSGTATNAIPAFANIDPPRMFQFQVRFMF